MLKNLLLIVFLFHSAIGVSLAETLCEKSDDNRSVHRDDYVVINQLKQWVTIHGENCRNPVILFLHGGPGYVDSPAARSQYKYWENKFTIVQWDQRGAGLTYAANDPLEKLIVGDMVSDGIELTEYLLQQLQQPKIILTGTSWGGALGMQIVHRRPDLFYAFVGRSVGVSWSKSIEASVPHLISLAQKANDQQSLKTLKSLHGQWDKLDNVLILQEIMEKYKAPPAESDKNYSIEPHYNNQTFFQAFEAGLKFSQSQTINPNGGLAFAVDLYKLDFDFGLPIFFIQGESDILTLPSVTQTYFEQIKAPKKVYILVPERGHDSAFIETNYNVMTENVLPLIMNP